MRISYKPTVNRKRLRKDNTFSVTIRIGVKSKYVYIETPFYISEKDLNSKKEIKNTFILSKCYDIIEEYKTALSFADDLSNFDAKMVRDYLTTDKEAQTSLNYVKLFNEYLDINKDSASYSIYRTTLNHLNRFHKDTLMVDDITPNFLTGFESYLKSRMGSRGVQLYLSRVRAVYNWIMDEYSYKGFAFNSPFRKYKMPKSVAPKTVALTREQLRAIIDIEPIGLRANRAKDLFVISLFMLGVNAVDLYKANKVGIERFEYNRSKTKDRRDDEAFISVKIEDEVKPYLEKYLNSDRELIFKDMYSNPPKLNEAIWQGLKSLREQINKKHGNGFIEKLEYYDARRAVASTLRNRLNVGIEDVSMVLNHVSNHKITDIYVETDFSRNDKCNRLFIDYILK